MTEAAVSIAQTHIRTLEELYTFRGRTEVLEFLNQHPFLMSVLVKAPERIRHYFPNSQLLLEVISDPEISDYVLLVLSILMKLDPYDAVARQTQLDMELWLKTTTHKMRGKLVTLLEYPDEF